MEEFELEKAIRKAIKAGQLAEVVRLIGNDDSRLQMVTPFGTWLHVAATYGQLEIARWLVSRGINVSASGVTIEGRPLDEAAAKGHLEVAQFLIDAGATLDVTDSVRNPLFAAIYGGHTAVAQLLIDRGIDTTIKYNGKNMTNMDALAFANEWGRTEIAELLKAHHSK